MFFFSNLPKGRGGRGAAILQALEQIQKLPVSVNGSSSNGLGLLNGSSSNGPGIVKGSSLNSVNFNLFFISLIMKPIAWEQMQ